MMCIPVAIAIVEPTTASNNAVPIVEASATTAIGPTSTSEATDDAIDEAAASLRLGLGVAQGHQGQCQDQHFHNDDDDDAMNDSSSAKDVEF